MHPKEFHDQIDQGQLLAAIKEIERHTAAKLHVYVSHRAIEEPLAQARRRFKHLGLGHWHHPHAVLIYLVPKTQKFAIIGDDKVHERFPEALWGQIAEALSADLKAGDITAALLGAVRRLGDALAEHFPAHFI